MNITPMSAPRHLCIALSLTLLPGLAACKKSRETTAPTEETTPAVTSSGAMRPTLPDQVAAPSGLDAAIMVLLGGDAQRAVDQLTQMRVALGEDDETLAARVAVSSWEVIAHCALLLPENGDDLIAEMQSWHARLERAGAAETGSSGWMMALATGVHLKALGDFEASSDHLRTAASADNPWRALAEVWLAEATLNAAYDDNNEKLEHPEKIDEAKPIYARANTHATRDLVRGMALEGLALIAEMKRAPDEACEFAREAKSAYEAAGASEYRLESPNITLEKNRCDES